MPPLAEGARRIAAVLLFFLAGTAPALAQAVKNDRPPNIVFILSDDEDLGIHPFMPKVKALIEDEGVTFDNAFVTYSLCCPSRSSILRGQYPHNTGVLGNLPPQGGFKTFRRLKREQSTIATWLHDAGYRTAFYGKYLNGYTEKDAPPPGWDEWHGGNNNGYNNFDYKLNSNGKVVAYGDAPEDYLTDVIADKATAHIKQFAAEGKPFFLYVSPFSPHSPYHPAPRHKGMFKDAKLPRPASFDEADVSDKPGFIQNLPALSEKDIDDITGHYRSRLECLQSVDEMAGRLIDTLKEVGQLDNTYVVYASDNGFHLGQHRMKEGKDTIYEEDLRVPFAMRGPGIAKGQRIDATVLNIDFSPTFAAMAGATPPDFIDGRSLLPLLKDPSMPWRHNFLVQRLGLEADERLKPANAIAVRTDRHTFAAYNDGEHELYDLETDPHQLHSMEETADPALVEALTDKITELKVCRADECREAEDAPVEGD